MTTGPGRSLEWVSALWFTAMGSRDAPGGPIPPPPTPRSGRALTEPLSTTDTGTDVSIQHGSDLELVRGAAAGDATAGRTLAERIRRVFRVRFVQVASRAPWLRTHEEDLTQRFTMDLVANDYRHLLGWSAQAPLDGWLGVIASRFLRRQAGALAPREVALESVSEPADARESPEALVARRSRAAAVRNALGDLADEDRVLLALLYEQELPAHEAGPALGLTPSGVRMRKSRLLKRLAKRLGHLLREDEE